MDNPIQFSDLFSEGIKPGVEELREQVVGFRADLIKLRNSMKTMGENLTATIAATSVVTQQERDAVKEVAAQIEQLAGSYKKANDAIKHTDDALKKMGDDAKKAGDEGKKGSVDMANAYKSLEPFVSQLNISLEELLKTEKEHNIVKRNGKVANEALEGSYNKLYAQYNLLKVALNAMSDEMRHNTAAGKAMEAESLRLMDTLKNLQAATGNHTLSVGHYEKALNGLSISTQQVLREMPTLANSLQQFFIAISNNVPIFVDNLKRVQQETGSWVVAMKGVMTSVFSWQTALLVVLTILPKIAKAIHDKRKAQQEDNKTTKETLSLLGLLREAMLAVAKAQVEDAAQLRTLVSIIEDHNRKDWERVRAAQALKDIYEDQLANYSAEEIALGKANIAIEAITSSIKKQAKARALLNKITEAYSKQIEVEDAARRMEIDHGKKLVWAYNSVMATLNIKDENKRAKRVKEIMGQFTEEEREQIRAYAELRRQIKVYGKEIDDLAKRIDVGGLFVSDDKGGKATQQSLDRTKGYYWEWMESIAELISDEEEREIELATIRIDREKATYEAILAEQKKAGTLTAENEQYLIDIIKNKEDQKQLELAAIRKKWYDIREKEEYEREVKATKDRYNAQIATASKTMLQAGEKYNKAVESNSYRQAKKEGAIYKQSIIEKLNLEAELQREVLKIRRDTGRISEEEYQIELAKIEESLTKSIANLESKRKGRRMNLWTMIFGKTTPDGKGNVYKELTAEQNQFISAFNGAIKTSMQYMNEWMSKRIEMAQIAVDAAHKETESAQSALDLELQARANGYANNVQLARREYEEKLAIEREAIEERKRLERIQEGINTAQQISSLITATANLWASYSSIPGVGMLLAIAATTAMWGSFAAAKITAAQMAKAKTYGEGGMEYIDYGGSHASGHDVDFGRTKDGRPRRIEKGEAVAVINKRNVNKYGVNTIGSIIDSLNRGTFEKQFGSGVVDSTNDLASMYALAFSGLGANGADLSTVERGIQTLVEQGSVKVVPTPYGRIEYRGNNKRIIRN